METIKLGVFGIVISTDRNGAGSIHSDLSKVSGSVGHTWNRHEYAAAIDAIESLILAHGCAGIDISSHAYIEGIETAVDACANR